MAEKNIDVGDKVQWNYGGSHPQGVAAEIKDHKGEKVQIESKKGNTITRNADPDNPAVLVERQGDGNNQDVVKRMSELTKVGEREEGEDAAPPGAEHEKEKEPAVGEKRDREAAENQDKEVTKGGKEKVSEEEEQEEEPEAKKLKVSTKKAEAKEANADEAQPATKSSKGRGRGRTTTATPGTRRAPGRTKKGAAASQEKSASATTREADKMDASGLGDEEDAPEDIPGEDNEVEEGAKVAGGDAPAGHTRSQNMEATAHN
ncbi:hypothetical protein NP233_g245 [Leucocoprinus birnbaumii]|uniref:Hypervirulence associated protein TUDOR domain-containing protein n=1 Tax=Leucocoprinus birnbaumii TaxID=56174 RepID=A0AAD5W2P2_9AGAR|nr:hypothetical protein NP233_g245 [Leucocoprinus birnbaumii]